MVSCSMWFFSYIQQIDQVSLGAMISRWPQTILSSFQQNTALSSYLPIQSATKTYCLTCEMSPLVKCLSHFASPRFVPELRSLPLQRFPWSPLWLYFLSPTVHSLLYWQRSRLQVKIHSYCSHLNAFPGPHVTGHCSAAHQARRGCSEDCIPWMCQSVMEALNRWRLTTLTDAAPEKCPALLGCHVRKAKGTVNWAYTKSFHV